MRVNPRALHHATEPDAFLRPFIEQYATLSSIYAVVRNAYTKKVYVDRAFQKKTNELVQKHIGAEQLINVAEFVKIDENTIDLIKRQKGGDGTKVINYAQWESREAFTAMFQTPEASAHLEPLAEIGSPNPALCEVVSVHRAPTPK